MNADNSTHCILIKIRTLITALYAPSSLVYQLLAARLNQSKLQTRPQTRPQTKPNSKPHTYPPDVRCSANSDNSKRSDADRIAVLYPHFTPGYLRHTSFPFQNISAEYTYFVTLYGGGMIEVHLLN